MLALRCGGSKIMQYGFMGCYYHYLGPFSCSLFDAHGTALFCVQGTDERADGGAAHDVDGDPCLLHGFDDTHV